MLIGGLTTKLANPAIVITANPYQGILTHANTLSDKTYTFPDKSGIVALITDLNRTGFPDRTSTTLTWNAGTRTITLAPVGSNFTVSVNGTTYTKTTQTSTIPNVTGGYFIYFDNTGTLQQTTTTWNMLTTAPIAYVYWDATLGDGFAFEERHTDAWTPSEHYYHHFISGTEALTGFAATGYNLAGAGGNATNAFNTYAIATGEVADEDIILSTSALADGGPYTIFNRTGATGTWTWTKTNTIPFKVGTTFPQYNQWTGATWQMTEGASLRYINYFVYATTSLDPLFQYIIIPGQNIYTSLALAQAETYATLQLGALPFQEIVPLYQITLRTGAGVAYNGATGSCRIEAFARITGSKTSINQAAITNHEGLVGLLGGDSTDGHFHLNLAQYTVLSTVTGGVNATGAIVAGSGGNSVYLDPTNGSIYANAMVNRTSLDNAFISVPITGPLISRNVADANSALRVNLIHASATGKILDLQFGGVSKASVDYTGAATFASNISTSGVVSANGYVSVNSVASTPYFELRNAGVRRFLLYNNSTGSQTSMIMYDGTGIIIDSPIEIQNAANGTIALNRPVIASNSITASSFIKSGGTSAQFLKADGSVDSSTYSTTAHNHTGVYQPLDADLTAIAALAGTTGILKKTAANTWALDTALVVDYCNYVDDGVLNYAYPVIWGINGNQYRSTVTYLTWNPTLKTFGVKGVLSIQGSTSGAVRFSAPAVAGSVSLTLPTTTGTLALTSQIPTVNAGTLGASAATAGATATTVALNFSAAWNANSASNVTINPVVGPSITALATLMTGATSGFIKKTAADTYTLDTSTYLTALPAHTLDSHSNVTITANSAGEILKWNGTAWINNTLAEAGIQPAGTYLTGTKVDSFNTRTGAVTLTSSDVTTALTFTPYNSTNPSSFIALTAVTDAVVTAKLLTSLPAVTNVAIAATDSILTAMAKLQGQINNKQASGTYLTAIGVTTANGVSGSSSGGATPNLTITLGAITPTSVNGLTLATNGNNGRDWATAPVPYITGSGVIEIGKYLDWHETSNDGIDYAARMTCTSGVIGFSGGVTASDITASGTLTAHGEVYIGGVIRSNGSQSVNLHLDPVAGTNATYLNFYQGTGGVNFGNGASGIVASVSSSGLIDASLFRTSFASGTNYAYTHLAGYYAAATTTGTIKIAIPSAAYGTMVVLRIVGYDYSSKNAWELVIGGYVYSTDANGWYPPARSVRGINCPFTSVRFAKDPSGYPCILLGVMATSWSHETITITEAITGYSAQNQLAGTTISLLANETSYVASAAYDPNSISTVSSVTATSFVKTSGTSAQFLKADGSVDSNAYSTTAHNHSGVYAPVAQTFYLGTTSIAINRTSGAIALTGITSIDGSSAQIQLNTTTSTVYLMGASGVSGTGYLYGITSVYMTNGTVYGSDFSASSDERLKENWEDLPIDFISQLAKVKVGTYHRIDNDKMSIGASAQSLQKCMPLAVSAGKDEMLSISYGNAALVSAVELAKEVEKLREEIAFLKERLAS